MEEVPVKVRGVGVRVALGSSLDTWVETHEDAEEVGGYGVGQRWEMVVGAWRSVTFRPAGVSFMGVLPMAVGGWLLVGSLAFRALLGGWS